MMCIFCYCFLEEEFQQLQQSFMEKHYLEFEYSDENKLSYTDIFNEYVSCWATVSSSLFNFHSCHEEVVAIIASFSITVSNLQLHLRVNKC